MTSGKLYEHINVCMYKCVHKGTIIGMYVYKLCSNGYTYVCT